MVEEILEIKKDQKPDTNVRVYLRIFKYLWHHYSDDFLISSFLYDLGIIESYLVVDSISIVRKCMQHPLIQYKNL